MASEISYRCFCAVGGLRNPRLWTKAVVNQRGEFVRTAYMDSGDGPLSWSNARPAGPS